MMALIDLQFDLIFGASDRTNVFDLFDSLCNLIFLLPFECCCMQVSDWDMEVEEQRLGQVPAVLTAGACRLTLLPLYVSSNQCK